MKDFKEIIIKDNFYQSSSYFPMPLTLIGTLNEDGTLTSYGAYSLISYAVSTTTSNQGTSFSRQKDVFCRAAGEPLFLYASLTSFH